MIDPVATPIAVEKQVEKPVEKPAKARPFLGKAVENGNLRFTSASQIATFSPESDGCPRKFAYQYVFGVKLPKTPAQIAGTSYAEDLEAWLSRGEMVLPPTLIEGKKFFPSPWNKDGVLDLECERPLGDMVRAVALRDDLLRGDLMWGDPHVHEEEIRRMAGVAAAGVPLEGAADYRHKRQEYVDGDGVLRREVAPYVVEIGDLKTISRIDDRVVMKGKRRGEIDRGYAKTAAGVCAAPQMLAYAIHAADAEAYRGVTHVRLSHVYCSTGVKGAAKRTGLLSVEEVRRRWAEKVEPTVRKMIEVAGALKIEDVEPNVRACDSYTHLSPEDGKTVLKGCGYRYQCPLSREQVAQSVSSIIRGETMSEGRSLFSTASPLTPPAFPSPPTPPAPPVSPADRAAEVAAERERLLAEERLLGPLVDKAFAAAHPENGANAILPPDAPRVTSMLDAAAPIPVAALAEITDPDLRARAEEHNRQHAARALAAAQAAPKRVGGRCPGGGAQVTVAIGQKRAACGLCGAERATTKEIRVAGGAWVFPGHNVPRPEEAQAPAPPAPPAPPAQADMVFATPIPVLPVPPSPPYTGPWSWVPDVPGAERAASDDGAAVILTAGEVEILSGLFRDRAAAIFPVLSAKAADLFRRLKLVG